MKRLSALLACCIAAAFLASCQNGTTPLDEFLADDAVRLVIDGTAVYVFDEDNDQIAYNEQRAVFRANTDTMLNYFELELSALPTDVGQELTGSIAWSSTDGERRRNNITLNVKRIKGDLIWLCDASQRSAAVVKVLK